MKRSRDQGEQFRNEMAAMAIIRNAPPEWLEFLAQVHRFITLHDRAKRYNLPRENAAAADALTDLRYVAKTLADAEQELAKPPIDFSHLGKGGAS